MNFITLPIHIFNNINSYLLNTDPEWYKGRNTNNRVCLVEYLIFINNIYYQYVLNYCNSKYIEYLKQPNKLENNNSLKINRCLILNNNSIYILQHKVYGIDDTPIYVWESYPSIFLDKKEFAIKVLSKLTSSIILDKTHTFIVNINNEIWNYYSKILKEHYNILINKPKLNDKVYINHKLEEIEINIFTNKGISIPYNKHNLFIYLTKEMLNIDIIQIIMNHICFVLNEFYKTITYDDEDFTYIYENYNNLKCKLINIK